MDSRYLRQWLDASYSSSPEFIPLSSAEQTQADQVVQTTFPTGSRVPRLEQVMHQCQDVINSCSFAGQSISSFDCCQYIRPYIGTFRGVCWVFDNDKMIQSEVNVNQGFSITFRMTLNSFHMNDNITVHPGIDIYLMNNSMEASRIASELQKPVTLLDKKLMRMSINKQYKSDLTRINCGVFWGQSEPVDREASRTYSTLPTCLLQQVFNFCGCFPVFSSFLNLDFNKYSQLSQQINQSTACSVAVYESCARKFLFYAVPDNWDNPVRIGDPSQVQDAVNNCRRDAHTPCQLIEFPADIETADLPPEYRTTPDYVSQLTVVYNSYMASSVVESRNPNFYQLLSNIGYNIGLWFAVGHIIWTLITTPCDWCCGTSVLKSRKITPMENGGFVHPSPRRVQNPDAKRIQDVDTNSLRPPAVGTELNVEKPPDEETIPA
ncbi:hypothetical protein FO519_002690 [Halicephalobus sp. NKZ332]|nr:hypothetical protein FO519_002690 [Halicephalobus sp. NKZ332]